LDSIEERRLKRTAALNRGRANRRTALRLGVVGLAMFGFGFALVPLYDVLCEVTGLNGKTGRLGTAVARDVPAERWVTVEFTGTVMSGLPWEFGPTVNKIRVRPGEPVTITYKAHNTAAESIDGQAVPSVTPGRAAAHFKKIECFCFSRQTLAAGQEKVMPVQFVVDPALPEEIGTITLSYAFFNATSASAQKYGSHG